MDCFYRSHLAFICIFIWSLAIFRTTDSGSITWHEPPPSETVIDTAITSTTETNLTKGSFNEELSCNFSLTADLRFETVSFEFDGVTVASYVKGRYPTVADRFVSRFNVTWVPSKLTLIVFKVTSDDKRKYDCRAQGSSSSHGLQAWLRIIKVDLLVQTQITNVTGKTVTEGGNVTLKCLAEGNPTPTVMWTRLSDHSVVTMPLTNIRRQNASVGYRCTANNGVKSPATRDVFLDVQYKPDHVSLNMSITNKVCTGMAVMFTCSAGAAKPNIQNYTLYKFVAGLTYISSNQFGIFNQILETGGQHIYRCEARNSQGYTSSSNRTLEVHVPASVKVENDTIVVLEGRNVTLYCFSSGFPSPNVSWLDNTVKERSILKLLNISRHRNGSYICLATNACGSDWGKVDINVQYPTEATGPGENATVAEGAVKLFTCSVDGNPEPGIEWYSENNGRILSNGKQLEASESGCYTCVASNNIGPPVNITHCLAIINASLTSVPPSIISPGGAVEAKVMIVRDYSDFYRNLDSGPSKKFVAWFVQEMDKIYVNMPEYNWTLVTGLRPGSVIVHFILHFKTDVTREKGLKNLWVAISSNGTFGGIEAEYVSDESATSHTPASPKPAVSASPPWTIVGAVAGGVVLLAILVGVLIWWVHKQRKCRKDTKNEVRNSDLGRQDDEGGYSQVPGAYAQSGPPAANGTNGAAAEQQLEGATAIPNYAVVDKSKKKKKLREEVPPVYAEVDKSKKKKKRIDDKNLYETLDEPKKAKIPGELLYADLGDFQNRAVSTVSISPQPLRAIKKPEAYERTDYADIAQFLKGNTTSPQNGGDEDTEWKPERPSKKKIQGKDNETQI